MANTVYINEELKVYIHKEYTKTVKSFIRSGNSLITINNLQNLKSYPYIELTIKKTTINPVLYFKNNSQQTTCQINGSFINGDKVIIDSMHKSIMKNTTLLNLNPSLYPVIQTMSYFEVYIDNTVADITLKYKTFEDSAFYTKSREDFNLQGNNKLIEIGKPFYNADSKENVILDGLQNFDFSVPVYDDYFLSMINERNTYRVVVDIDNSDDEFSRMKMVLCNCTLQQSLSSGSNSLINYKINGIGRILGTTPKLHDLFYESSSVQVILTNLTKNLICEIPYCEVGNVKFNTQYREKKVFRSKPKKILESMSVSLDLNNILTSTIIKDWVGDNLTASVNFYNANGSIPISITDAIIENPSWNPEKDSFVKQQFTLSGNL